jgi:ABC-2 type transport system ATP-binding protein
VSPDAVPPTVSPDAVAPTASPEAVASFTEVQVAFHRLFRPPIPALQGLSLQVERGQVVGLLGPNGAGKTTALCCLLGLLRPTSGKVLCFGRPVTTTSRQKPDEQVGVLLEETKLPPFLTARQILEAVCEVRGLKDTKKKEELDRIVNDCRVEQLLDRRAATLSKGQARKVGLAAALVADPPLLILDEPSAGLDASVRIEFEQMLLRLKDGKRTVIIASHLLGEVEAACTHIAVMTGGRAVVSGRTDTLLEQARADGRSEIHVSDADADTLDRLTLSYERSRYPGLLLITADLPDQELMTRLQRAGVFPRRVEPGASLKTFYLAVVGKEQDKSE